MLFRQIFEPKLAHYAYLIGCQKSREAVLIDPQRDVDRYLAAARAEGVTVTAVTETHIHADYLSGSRELAERGLRVYLSGEGGADWRYRWSGEGDVVELRDGDRFHIGNVEIQAVHTPGHTPEHLSFLVTDHGGGVAEPMGLVSGDFVFVGDLGRPDLLESAAGKAGAMEPSARDLYRSVQQFRRLPDYLQVWPAHGAGSACGKALGAVPNSTVGYEKRFNPSITAAASGEEPFVRAILEGQPEPPTYFHRMKILNRDGAPILGELPTPERLAPDRLAAAADQPRTVILDTRLDRTAFMAGHLPGALFAPLNKTFPTIAGSYVMPDEEIVLLVEPDRLQEAVLDLVRIGLDRIVGWAPADDLAGLELVSTPVTDFAELAARPPGAEPACVLDVRRAAEFAAGSIDGAVNIAHTRLAARLDEIPEDGEIFVHCLSGARAASAASLLERAGRRVRYIDDAFK